jgi:hypothetical protein
MTARSPLLIPRQALALVAAWSLLAGQGAAPPVSGGPTVPSDPLFSALLVDGKTVTGRIRQIGQAGDVTLVPPEGPEETIPFRRLVKLTREGALPSLSPEKSMVLLPEGDRLYRTVIGTATDTTLEVQSYTFDKLSIPLDHLSGLVIKPPDAADECDDLVHRVRTEPRSNEILWLAPNGDRVTGGFLGLDEHAVKFQSSTGPITIDLSKVVAVGFDSSLVVYPKPAGDYFELTSSDGSRLGVSQARIEQGQVIATTRFNATIKLPLGDLVHAHARSKSIVYLSERRPAAVQYVPYVGPTRPMRLDSSVDGHPLRLGGQTYDRGLGTQSRTLAAYRLAQGDRRFQATVGLDDRAGPLGSVVFRVLVDDQEKFASPPMSAHDIPKPIDLDVTGAKVIILLTEFGERGDVRDFADWVEARFIR